MQIRVSENDVCQVKNFYWKKNVLQGTTRGSLLFSWFFFIIVIKVETSFCDKPTRFHVYIGQKHCNGENYEKLGMIDQTILSSSSDIFYKKCIDRSGWIHCIYVCMFVCM